MMASQTSGIDVSGWQGAVAWDRVAAAGYEFAIAKATEGTYYKNPFFEQQWTGAKRAGMVRGAYHFAQPDESSARAEARFFLDRVGTLEEGDLLALDLEAGSGNLASWTTEWLTFVQDQVGFRPLLYSGPYFLAEHGCVNVPTLCDFGLWLASYRATWPPTPRCWPFIAIWQHTSSLSVPGVAGPCDGDYFNGSRAQLVRYGKPGAGIRADDRLPAAPADIPAYTYVVRAGETAATIAAACRSTVDDLLYANPRLRPGDEVKEGTLLNLPNGTMQRDGTPALPSAETFVARSSTNLAAIAGYVGVSLLALQIANPQLNPDQIPMGTTVSVPVAGLG